MDDRIMFNFFYEPDAVQKAIEKGYNQSILISQTWEECQRERVDKKIVVYGLGDGIYSFVRDYGMDISIDCMVDSKKSGMSFADFCFVNPDEYDSEKKKNLSALESMFVEKPQILDTMDLENTVVIIVSLANYMEIYDMLATKGVTHCFSYLCMEANKRSKEERKYLDPKMEFIHGGQMLPINQNLIAVQTIGGYCGHSRQVSEQLKKINPNYEFVWVVPNKKYEYHFPEGSQIVRQGTPDYYRVMTKAKLWLFEEPLIPEIPKRQGQYCIQLKHWASVTLKTFGHTLNVNLPNYNEDFEKKLWKYNDDITDCYIVGSDFDERTIREGFLYTHECFYAGSPRSDLLFKEKDYKKVVCNKYNLNYNNKLCLYAPTFRYDNDLEYAYNDTMLDFFTLKKALEKVFGGQWNILLRLHPRVQAVKKHINSFPDFVIDVSTYMDSEELVAASDIMITDYSSIMFEPAFIKKPVFLYAPDLDIYLQNERSFLLDYNKLPFSIAHNNDELIENIWKFNKEEYSRCLDAFFKEYGINEDGHASERAAEFIINMIRK